MNWNVIESAMEQQLASLNLGLAIVAENVAHEPPPGVPYIGVTHYHVDSEKIATGVTETAGITLFMIFFPAGTGPGSATSLADRLADGFLQGTSLPAGNGYVVMQKLSLGHKEPSVDPAWWALPLSVYYTAYHTT
jgi:hypothetical protein